VSVCAASTIFADGIALPECSEWIDDDGVLT
jgi:hypothetical protein